MHGGDAVATVRGFEGLLVIAVLIISRPIPSERQTGLLLELMIHRGLDIHIKDHKAIAAVHRLEVTVIHPALRNHLVNPGVGVAGLGLVFHLIGGGYGQMQRKQAVAARWVRHQVLVIAVFGVGRTMPFIGTTPRNAFLVSESLANVQVHDEQAIAALGIGQLVIVGARLGIGGSIPFV